ncbi:HAMP domain-containing sensor histidine kinase [Paenibacillus phoenicis]|uniref:histidine kinase n=2 Tax=Paenibacillus TaxID=44249 RepID=A0ABW3SA51_9BACL|nr:MULTISPECIES: HAMP domain-containing sensor histidine kinase [Paenibacillaceae]EES73390.1 ATPase/histidine kinase/DNA gyrase B/HSP90 domain protein [Paenibacillus sp. oral taxon 786 str. D14]MCH1638850.1 HAMP domain-containing histidine kinase [Paenibacillus timonensis]MEA3570705.1 HAMP domain-containing sensor histidine kinase [Paenibacillus phoenicis]
MRRNKIGFRLGLMILVAFVVVILSLGLTIDRMFTNFYNSEMRTEVNELTTHFTAMSQSPEMLSEETLLKFADFSNVSILFVSEQGDILANSGTYEISDRTFIKPKDLKLLFTGKAVKLEHTDANGERYFVAARPVLDATGVNIKAAVYVLSSTGHMDESITAVRSVLVLSGLGAFLLALGITWIIAKILSRPMLQMQAATRKIAAGELETRLTIQRDDEIGVLADSINHLAIELQRYRDTRQEFFANISHELRTPITYLEGYAQVLKKRLYETEEEKDKYLDIIHEEAMRLQHLVDDLFDLAKMEEGKVSLSLEWIDLAEITDNAVQKIKLKAGEKNLSLQTKINSNIPLIYGDGLRTEQVLLNLLENAVRYTEKGSIVVELDQNRSFIYIAVEDTGMGIPEDEIPYIFDRFYRVEKSRSRQYGGTGLGLPIAKKLVELQGGELKVFSKLGHGTRFEIRFVPEHQEERI